MNKNRLKLEVFYRYNKDIEHCFKKPSIKIDGDYKKTR